MEKENRYSKPISSKGIEHFPVYGGTLTEGKQKIIHDIGTKNLAFGLLWNAILQRKNEIGLHLFLDSVELFDFLKTQEIKKPNIKEYVLKHGETGEQWDELCVFIHHKDKRLNSVQYKIISSKANEEIFFSYVYGKGLYYCTEPYGLNHEGANLTYNSLLYMDAFPDCVTEGTPDEIKTFESLYKAKNRIKLTAHESLIDRSGVTPHMRRGHFRKLTAERYKKARGKVIFVHSCMVKGHAKTVHDKEEKETAFKCYNPRIHSSP